MKGRKAAIARRCLKAVDHAFHVMGADCGRPASRMNKIGLILRDIVFFFSRYHSCSGLRLSIAKIGRHTWLILALLVLLAVGRLVGQRGR